MTNNIQGNSHKCYQLSSQQKLYKPEGNSMIYLKWWKKKPTTKNTLPTKILIQIWWRNQKLSKQAKVKRNQHHQTSFTTNAKKTFLGRKHKRRKTPTEDKPKTIKKMVIGSYVSIITLYVHGLNAPTKKHRLAGQKKTCACMHVHLPHHSAWLPKLYVIILYC